MSDNPEVSILLSVLNAGNFLEDSIHSIINQSFKNFELIITDDNSSDDSLKKLESFSKSDKRIRLYSNNTSRGLPTNLNKMASVARGKYFARMDADDICKQNRLQLQYSYMENNPSTDACFGEVNLIKHNGELICKKWMPKSISSVLEYLPYMNYFVHPTVMIRKSSFEEVGGYNELFLKAQDWDLWTRMVSSNMRLDIIRQVLLDYRINENGNSASLSSSSFKSKIFRYTSILIQNKNRFKALKLCYKIPFAELPEFFIRLILPMWIFRLMLKKRANKSKDSVINRLLAQDNK
jgi:glycosyltransferase involved in cell wall biosynthesis